MKVLLDTNFLMLPAQRRVDIYRELKGKLVTLKSCVRELEELAEGRGRAAIQARVALELAKGKVRIVDAKGSADKVILSYAAGKKCAVATNDRKLIKSLKRHGVKIIRLRQGKFIISE